MTKDSVQTSDLIDSMKDCLLIQDEGQLLRRCCSYFLFDMFRCLSFLLSLSFRFPALFLIMSSFSFYAMWGDWEQCWCFNDFFFFFTFTLILFCKNLGFTKKRFVNTVRFVWFHTLQQMGGRPIISQRLCLDFLPTPRLVHYIGSVQIYNFLDNSQNSLQKNNMHQCSIY